MSAFSTATPWGQAEYSENLGQGLWVVRTASHGGYFVAEDLLHHILILFLFQRTRRIDQASSRRQLRESGAQDRGLAVVQLGESFCPESPFDLGIAREGAGSGAGDVGENAMKRND